MAGAVKNTGCRVQPGRVDSKFCAPRSTWAARPRTLDQGCRRLRTHALKPPSSEASLDPSKLPPQQPQQPQGSGGPSKEPQQPLQSNWQQKVEMQREEATQRQLQIEQAVAKASAVQELIRVRGSRLSQTQADVVSAASTTSANPVPASPSSSSQSSFRAAAALQQSPTAAWDDSAAAAAAAAAAGPVPLSPAAAAVVAGAPAPPKVNETQRVLRDKLEAATTPQERTDLIEEAKRKSEVALQDVRRRAREDAGHVDGHTLPPRLIDIRMYEQLVSSRDRLLKSLSASKQHARWLEAQVDERNENVAVAYDTLSLLALEVSAISRLARTAIASVRYSPTDVEEKLGQVAERMDVLYEVLGTQVEVLDAAVLREVPVSWFGVASEVRIMGSFDDWTAGIYLSAEASAKDGTMTTFEGKLLLPKGKYLIKFLVDGEWRLAGGEWPISRDEQGDENNVLVVE